MVALRDHGKPEDIVATLSGLTLSGCFEMTLMMLPEEDERNLKAIFSKLDANDAKVQALRAKFKL